MASSTQDAVFATPFSMAFQPIVAAGGGLYGYEALVRGVHGQGAAEVMGALTEANRSSFDGGCRRAAMALAARLGLASTEARLTINLIPNAVDDPELLAEDAAMTAEAAGLACGRVLFELSETEPVDPLRLAQIAGALRRRGFRVALDDFGGGYSGLSLLARFQPDLVKLDMAVVRGVDGDPRRRAVVRAVVGLCRELVLPLVAEGVETRGEAAVLVDLGVELMQGYAFARPAFESLSAGPWGIAA